MNELTIKKEKWNAVIEFNKRPLFMWGKGFEKDAVIDDFDSPKRLITDNVDKSLYKVSPFEIIMLKYVPVVLIIWLMGSFVGHYTSMLGLALGCSLYLIGGFLKSRFGLQTTILIFSVIPATYLLLGFNNFAMFSYYSVGMTLNYAVQYVIWAYVLHNVYNDLINKTMFKYYKIDDFLFRYILIERIRKSPTATTKYQTTFKVGVALFALFGLFVGGVDLLLELIKAKDLEIETFRKIIDFFVIWK